MDKPYAIELKNITKKFGDVVANNNISFGINQGEIVALLGENGSGKTTLMNMIAGIYYPDSGEIFVKGEPVIIKSPHDAYGYNIGMVHQHFKLVDVFTATDNIILGEKKIYSIKENFQKLKDEPKNSFKEKLMFGLKTCALPFKKLWFRLSHDYLAKNRSEGIKSIIDKYGFDIDLNKKIYDMSVSEKQTVEIIKTLYRGANILILDEPTAVLTPQETAKLFNVIRKMREDGKSIIIITHKLNEVLEISDRVAILRKGEYITTVLTKDATENSLTELMVGEKIELNINRPTPVNPTPRLEVKDLSFKNEFGLPVLKNISFTANSGEILGIAGIAGSGQKELLESIAGLLHYDGKIIYHDPKTNEDVDLKLKTPAQIRQLGVKLSFVPEDRLGMGLVGNMDIIDNVMLRSYENGKSFFLNKKDPESLANRIISDLEVVTPSNKTEVRKLSGGNVQKILVGREISSNPTVLMAAYPVRGLDINSSYAIYDLLNKQKENDAAVIFVGEDLDVLIALCDRILVICDGEVTGIVMGEKAKKEEIGLMMTKNSGGEAHE